VFSNPSFHFFLGQVKRFDISFHKFSIRDWSAQKIKSPIALAHVANVSLSGDVLWPCKVWGRGRQSESPLIGDKTQPLEKFLSNRKWINQLLLYRRSVSLSSFIRYCWKSSCIKARPSLLHFLALANLRWIQVIQWVKCRSYHESLAIVIVWWCRETSESISETQRKGCNQLAVCRAFGKETDPVETKNNWTTNNEQYGKQKKQQGSHGKCIHSNPFTVSRTACVLSRNRVKRAREDWQKDGEARPLSAYLQSDFVTNKVD